MSSGPSSPSSPRSPGEPSTPKRKHHNYKLRVTAGLSYDTTTHVVVPVNAPRTLHLDSQHMRLCLSVRIRHFTGFPISSPTSSPYFDHPLHQADQYSISFSFIPKVAIAGDDLIFGNDFDRPIRDRLPPGFSQAFRIAKWFVDPGLEGDPYSDTPYLYGPALSSWNMLRIGEKISEARDEKVNGDTRAVDSQPRDVEADDDPQTWEIPDAESFHDVVVQEGADGSGSVLRSALSIPPDSSGRRKYFLTESNRQNFTFEAGRLYQSDFGNPYLDFNDFSLKLPGFSLNVIKYVDEKTHELRYVLKNRTTDDIYAVVLFSLLFGDERDEVGQKHHPPLEEEPPQMEVSHKTSTKVIIPEGEYGHEPPPAEDDVD